MLKILQARLQQYENRELPNVQAGFRKGKAREFQKNIYFCFIDYAKAFDYVDESIELLEENRENTLWCKS